MAPVKTTCQLRAGPASNFKKNTQANFGLAHQIEYKIKYFDCWSYKVLDNTAALTKTSDVFVRAGC